MKIADETALSRDSLDTIQREFSDDDLNYVTLLYYKAFEEDPVNFSNYIRIEFNKWSEKIRENGGIVTELKPATKRRLLEKQIANKYGIPFTEIIGTPALLRVKFISLSKDWVSVIEDGHRVKYKYFVFLIEDILKGHKFFSISDTIRIISIGNVESPSPNFVEGVSYLVPIKPRIGLEEYNSKLAFSYLHDYYDRWLMGEPPKTFPILDEKITGVKYFGIQDTSWNEFKNYFNEKYLIFD